MALGLLLGSMALAACGPESSAPKPGAYKAPATAKPRDVSLARMEQMSDARGGIQVPHMEGRRTVRVGLVLPLTHKDKEVADLGKALLSSAQLALFEANNPNVLLIPKDTGGSPYGAAQATRAAIDEGAEIILGPLFADSVREAGAVARNANIPMIAFSTDREVAGDGVYLLSFLPEQEVKRITEFAMTEGYYAFAALIPVSPYGERVRSSFQETIDSHGGVVTIMQSYPRVPEEMFGPAKVVAEYETRRRALRQKKEEALEAQAELQANPGQATATVEDSDLLAETQPQMGDPSEQTSMIFDPVTGEVMTAEEAISRGIATDGTWGGVSYQAILMPEGGTLLRSLAPLMPYFDVDPREIKFLGTGLWDDPSLGKEPALVGGWFAAPAPKSRKAFMNRYEKAYGQSAPRISSLAFDAVALISALATMPERSRFAPNTLENPNGFAGIDGIFRFMPDGVSERGLAVMQVQPNGQQVISPAPKTSPTFQEGLPPQVAKTGHRQSQLSNLDQASNWPIT